MRASRLLLPVILLLAAASLAQTWTAGPTSSFSYTRFDGAYHPVTKKVYFPGGRLSAGTTDSSIYSYDPATGIYQSLSFGLSVGVSNYTVAPLNIHSGADSIGLVIVGGRNSAGAGVTNVQVYLAVSNSVVTLTTDPWPGTIGGGVTQPAQGVVSYNDKIYAFGGFNNLTSPYMSDSTYVFSMSLSPGSRWQRAPANLSVARGYVVPAVVDGLIYAIGGDTYDGATLYASTVVERLDPANLAAGWQTMASLPTPLGEGQAFGFDTGSPYGLGGYIILAGGGAWPNDTAGCYIYNVAANAWTSFPYSLANTRRDHAGVMIPDTLYANGDPGIWVFGGRSGADTYVLNIPEYLPMPFPPIDVSATPGDMQVTLSWHAMSGTVLAYKVFRGTTPGGPYDSIGTTAVNAYTDSTAANGTTYYYVVKARYQIGAKVAESINSPEVTATPAAKPILLVDDDGSNGGVFPNGRAAYTAALVVIGQSGNCTEYETALGANGPSAAWYQGRSFVIWFTGGMFNSGFTLTATDETNLAAYLNAGGKLFLSSQDYLYDRYSSAGAFTAGQFPYDYLGLASVSQDFLMNTTYTIAGVSGSLADGTGFTVQELSPDHNYPDNLTRLAVAGTSNLFTVPAKVGEITGIAYDNGTFRTVFFAMPFENLVDGSAPSTKAELMGRILNWLNTGVECKPDAILAKPMAFSLDGNYPNPMRGQTDVRFAIPRDSEVRIDVYNIAGQHVRNLADRTYTVGYHQVRWNGADDHGQQVAAGVYLLRMSAPAFNSTRKIIVIR